MQAIGPACSFNLPLSAMGQVTGKIPALTRPDQEKCLFIPQKKEKGLFSPIFGLNNAIIIPIFMQYNI